MAYKDLLVHLDTSRYCKARLTLAESLARRFDAHLTGIYVMPPPVLSPLLADQFPPKVLEEADAQLAQKRDRVQAEFVSAVKALGAKSTWIEGEVDEVEVVSRAARHADLLLMGQTPPRDSVPGIPSDFPERVLMGSGRPALLVPYAGSFKSVGERVLIAWNASPQSARAVAAALPFLAAARHIEVLAIATDKEDDEALRQSAVATVQHLSRHGIKAEAHHIIATDIGAGDMLLSRAADEAADLVVMGVYGHSRLRELVLGGVSRDLLQRMTVPLFMVH